MDALGRRSEQLDEDRDQLAKDREEVLRRGYGEVPVAEAARRLKIHRTTVYRVYAPHEQHAA